MISPILALRAAIRTRLVADAALTALLGGQRVYDETPRAATTPYVSFGPAEATDWRSGAAAGPGARHALSLVAWSQEGGDSEALAVVARMAALLDDAALTLADHRLVLLRVTAQEAGRPDISGLRRTVLRLAALTEPL